MLAALLAVSNACAGELPVDVVSPLDKIFRDTVPLANQGEPVLRVKCAANEYDSAQSGLRSDEKLDGVSIGLSDLANEELAARIPSSNLQWHFVGYVPVDRNTTDCQCGAHRDIPEGELLRIAPFDCPDPLLHETSVTLQPGGLRQPCPQPYRLRNGSRGGVCGAG